MNRPQELRRPLELIKLSAEFLAEKGVENARLDAELLLARVLDVNRLQLYVGHERPIVPAELDRYRELIRQRAQRVPVQLLLGDVQLLDRVFSVRPGVFIPRPETETLIRRCIELEFATGAPSDIVEVGVGTGCIGISLLDHWPKARLRAYDVNPKAIELTQLNAEAYDVGARIDLRAADAFAGDLLACDLLVSNPPYLDPEELAELAPEVRDHDPREALVWEGGALGAIERLVSHGCRCLRARGWLIFEHALGQAEAARARLHTAGYVEIRSHRDLAGIERVCEGRRP
ncbi:MAG TPA: peptide chain release factor N(5)-glutamine methyltransferase [Candidatus Krumholzibacteria bacterium]